MASIFEQWAKSVDEEQFKKEQEEIKNNGGAGDRKEVPCGKYEVAVNKMEMKLSKSGKPMMVIWFKVLSEGSHKNSIIFVNQLVDTPYKLHIALELLRSMESGVVVEIDTSQSVVKQMDQLSNIILDVYEKVDDKLEYALDYGQNDKGFSTYRIEEVFDVQ